MQTLDDIRGYWKGKDNPCMATIVPSPVCYHRQPDAEFVRIACEVINSWEKTALGLPACFEANFGTFTMPLPWGGKIIGKEGCYHHIEAISDNIDEVLAIKPGVNPHIERAIKLYKLVCEQTGRDDIRFMIPDFQGVLNTASMIMDQTAFLTDIAMAPDKIHRFLDCVYETNVAFFRQLLERVGRIDGAFWPPVWMPADIGIMVVEDMMPMLSAESYKEFGIPYLKRLSDEFGGIFFHCCGKWDHHMKTLAESNVNILGFEFHYPSATIDQINEYFDNVVVVPYLDAHVKTEYPDMLSYVKDLNKRRKEGIRLWFAGYDDSGWPMEEIQALINNG